MKFVIIRHGETDKNISQIHQDAETPLNERGQAQARALSSALAHEKIDAIYMSDFRRTCETADEIAAFHPEAEIIRTSRLREKNNGIFIGLPHAVHDKALADSGVAFHEFTPVGGESLLHVQNRAVGFYKELIAKYAGTDKTIVLVTHGWVIATIFLHLFGQSLEEYTDFGIKNTSMTILEVDKDGRHTIKVWNSTAHLNFP